MSKKKNSFLSIFPLSSGTEKSHCGLDPLNSEGVPAAKNSLPDSVV
jgi:hypothetical protein